MSVKSQKIMEGKKGVVMGLMNQRSIAYGISKHLYDAGAKIAFSVQNELLKSKLSWIADDFKTDDIFQCDVSDEKEIQNLFDEVKEKFGFRKVGYATDIQSWCRECRREKDDDPEDRRSKEDLNLFNE